MPAQSKTPPQVLQQYVDGSAFLWELRDKATADSHYSLSDLYDLDSRVEAHIDGLRTAGDFAWTSCSEALKSQEAGEAFAAGVLALESDDGEKLTQVLDVIFESQEAERGLAFALGWVAPEDADKWIATLIKTDKPHFRRVALAGLAIRREAMASEIASALQSDDNPTKARALRAIGETKQRSMLPKLHEYLQLDDESCRFWAAWSAALLGDKNIGETLKSFVDFDTQFAYRAIQLAPRILDAENCRSWLSGLAQEETSRRYALIGCGVTGDPVYIPTLINQTAIPEYARVAGEAFSMITGIDLAYDDLDMDQPEDFEAGPTEDPADENVDLDPDEDLPWPNPELIQNWWNDHGRAYQVGTRYLCGQPISDANCRRVLREGFQRQRIAAAYELALTNPDEPLFEWRAPGWRQQEWLGLRKPGAR